MPNDKASIRRQVKERRQQVGNDTVAAAGVSICDHLTGWLSANCHGRPGSPLTVMAYEAFGKEIPLDQLFEWLGNKGDRLVLPRTNRADRNLELYLVQDRERDLAKGTLGIREPDPARCSQVKPDVLDAIVAPGLAFDRQGNRIGYGGGYYDRFLSGFAPGERPPVLAVGLPWQLFDALPHDEHDQPVDHLFSTSGMVF